MVIRLDVALVQWLQTLILVPVPWLQIPNTTGGNVAVGYQTLNSGTSGLQYNVAIGYQAQYNATSSNNIAIGYQALYKATASSNIGIGVAAGSAITSGTSNIIVGNNSASLLATGQGKSIFGAA